MNQNMFTVRKRHGSTSSLSYNPELSSRLSKRKQTLKIQQAVNSKLINENKSSRILPKINSPKKESKISGQFLEIDVKKQQKNQVKQLSMSISKYYINRAQYVKKPFNELAYNILSVIDNFSQVENNFQQLFQFISKDLKTFVLMTGQLNAKYNVKQGEVYKKAIQDIDRASHKKMKQVTEQLRQMTDKKQQIELQYSRYQQVWQQQSKKYLQEIQWYKKIANKQYTAYLQQKLKQSQQRIQELQQSQKQLVRLRDQYQKQLSQKQQTIQEQIKQIARLTSIMCDMKTAKAESQKFILKLRDRFDQINFKMIGMKDVINSVQKENQQLKTQRSALSKRAAVNFQELTPRPQYKKMFTFTQKQQNKKLKSTQEITELIVSKIKHIQEDQLREQLFDNKLNSHREHPKLQNAMNFRNSTINSISQSKQQLKQVRKLLSKDSFQ